jgi:hypothetical protein
MQIYCLLVLVMKKQILKIMVCIENLFKLMVIYQLALMCMLDGGVVVIVVSYPISKLIVADAVSVLFI